MLSVDGQDAIANPVFSPAPGGMVFVSSCFMIPAPVKTSTIQIQVPLEQIISRSVARVDLAFHGRMVSLYIGDIHSERGNIVAAPES